MKKLFTITFGILFWLNINATNYYLANAGNDNNTGTSSGSPWKTITKLNTVIYAPGDTVFFLSGDTFRGSILISQGGNTGVKIAFTSYGSGNKPIISGANSIINWTLAGSYYQANFTQTVVNFFVNDKEQILARYPDEGSYLTVDAATNNYIQDATLTGISSTILNASQVCVHTAEWCWEKSEISSSAGNKIIYLTPTLQIPTADYGYFLYDDTTYLTSVKEWKYDASASKIYYKPSSGSPNTLSCEASVRPYGIAFAANVSEIVISDISFEKQAAAGIGILDSTNQNIIIDDCYFAHQYITGIDVQGKNIEIKNSYFREIDGFAVYIQEKGFKANIHHNTFRNNGGFRNSGVGAEINLSAIRGSYFVDSCHIHHNDIDSVGYCGIAMDGQYNLIERNIIKHAMLINNDGAALKSYGVNSKFNVFKNNFVSSSDGNIDGTPSGDHFITPAIYFDFDVSNCTIQENTIYDRIQKGIFLNAGTNNNTVIGNVVYGGNFSIDYNGVPNPNHSTPMGGMTVKYNSFFAKDADAYIVRMIDNTGGYNHGIVDENYYFQPYNSGKYALIAPSTDYTFAQWLTTGLDPTTKRSFVNWTLPTSHDTLIMNQTDNIVTISLGTKKYLDLDSNDVCGSIILQPYSSKILIKTPAVCLSTGINENSNFELIAFVYPNPFSDRTTLEIKNGSILNYELNIYDLFGKEIKKYEIRNRKTEISRGDLPNGMYLYRVKGNNQFISSGKLIIQ